MLFEAIENALMNACRSSFGKAENVKVVMDRETCEYSLYAEKTVVASPEEVIDKAVQISLDDALKIDREAVVGGIVKVYIDSPMANAAKKGAVMSFFRVKPRCAGCAVSTAVP